MGPQSLLALVLGCGIIAGVVIGYFEPYPDTWVWEDAAVFFRDNFHMWSAAALLYYPVIFGYADSCSSMPNELVFQPQT